MIEIKNVLRRFLSLLLVIAMTLAWLPQISLTAFAAASGTVTGLSDENIGLSFSGDADGVWSANGTTIIGSVTSTSGTCGDTKYESTLEIKNNKSTTATLTFDYTIQQNSGTIQVAGNAVTTGNSYVGELEAGDLVKVYLKSGSTSAATKITITNISLVSDVTATTTFQPSENGSFTVDGSVVTEEISNTQSSLIAYQLVATPAEGYQFMGWYNVTTGKYFSTDASTQLKTESDGIITARFSPIGTALFETGGQVFDDLNAAITYAQDNSQSKITLISDGTISGKYTIPEGITLLIPFDADKTMYTTTPATTAQAWETPSPFRTLTLAESASITVNGAISVSAKHCGDGNVGTSGHGGGAPTGKYGYIVMSDDSDIIVNNGGALYVWGYISGNGTVTANSGATVYENMQIRDFRGGSASLSLATNAQGKSFLFNQYYIQNIESELVLKSGADEYVYSSLYASSQTQSTSVHFIGDGGMFTVDAGGYFTKKYLSDQDRLEITVEGDASINNLSLSLMGMAVSSQDYVLPITNNMSISILSGTTTITQDVSFLPGVKVSVAQGATLKVAENCNVNIYDRDEWIGNNFAFYGNFHAVTYSPTRTYTRSDADLTDAQIDVNGTVQANGYIYTTSGGADICSSLGTGKVVLAAGAGTATSTYQVVNASYDVTPIDITPAKLHNADDSYTETAEATAGDTIDYVDGKWGGQLPADITVTFEANNGTGSMDPQTMSASTDTALNSNLFAREGYTFDGWNTDPDGNGTAYSDGAAVNFAEDTTLYAQWKINTYTVTWVNDDGTELEKDENIEYGTTPTYNGETPSKAGDAQYSYAFKGWTPEITSVSADITYKAVYEESVNQYTVTWKNWDGTELKNEQVAYGETPAYTGDAPTKQGNAEYTYSFSGWTPDITPVTGNVEYTAVFTDTINTYTVTWVNWDKTELEKDENVAYGTEPQYDGDIPSRDSDEQYSYTFKCWSPSVDTVTGDITYIAIFDQTTNKYTITWKNWDGTELKNEQVAYGETPVYSGEDPAKEADEQYEYTFKGWTPKITSVTGDTIYTAEFDQAIRTYTVTWKNADGTVLATDTDVEYGTRPYYGGTEPTQESDEQYIYTFKGWSPEITEETVVTGNVTYTAVYDKTVKTYTITWVNEDGTELEKDENVAYGTMPEYNGTTPSKDIDDDYRYTFSGWEPEIGTVTGDATYKAVYTQTPLVKYTVTFDANDGEGSMEAQVVVQGEDTALAANSFTRPDHEFTGWNTEADGSGATYADQGSLIGLIEDITLYAQWKHNDGWFTYDNGKQYYQDGVLLKTGWTTIEDAIYYLDPVTGYAAEGGIYWLPYPEGYGPDQWDIDNNNNYITLGYDQNSYFIFNEDGKFENDMNGMCTLAADTKVVGGNAAAVNTENTVWVKNGELPWHPGLVFDESGYYYFTTGYFESGKSFVANTDYYVSKSNDLAYPYEGGGGTFTTGKYTFDADGKVQLYDGFVDIAGSTYYYIKGVKTYAGLIQIGDDYYYINSACKVIKGQSYTVSKTNGLLPVGTYTFDDDGKLIREDVTKNGIVKETEDTWYYYVNGVKTYAGLIQIDGDYYYVNSNFEVIHNRNYFISKTNELLPQRTYYFDTEGKLVQPEEGLNGIVKETDDTWYYYDNGVKTYAGLIQIGEDYYYVNSSCQVIHGRTYYISKTNGLMDQGNYTFDAEGKMIRNKDGIVVENGSLYYYENGKLTYAGLIVIDGGYYYVRSNGEVVHGKSYYVSKTNGLLPAKSYTFDESGRMLESES